jgi:hypothetical protein
MAKVGGEVVDAEVAEIAVMIAIKVVVMMTEAHGKVSSTVDFPRNQCVLFDLHHMQVIFLFFQQRLHIPYF